MDQVHIQAQDTSGVWRTYHTTQNQSQKVLIEMKSPITPLRTNLRKFLLR